MTWLAGAEGTADGAAIASALALFAAILHALFGALQKGRHDPFLSRMAIDLSYGVMALPVALFVLPWPEPALWPILGGVFVIHLGYKAAQALTYAKGAYTVVYPVVRGTGPLFAVIVAGVLFGESYTAGQIMGIAVLLSGIFGLAGYNLTHRTLQRETLPLALGLAVLTGLFVACYTTYDAFGIRQAANPFTFLAWFFVIDALNFAPLVAIARRRQIAAMDDPWPLVRRGLLGGLVALGSFGSFLLATRLGPVGQAGVLRETSTVFSALIGWLMLGEKVGRARLGLIALIASGAIMMEALA